MGVRRRGNGGGSAPDAPGCRSATGRVKCGEQRQSPEASHGCRYGSGVGGQLTPQRVARLVRAALRDADRHFSVTAHDGQWQPAGVTVHVGRDWDVAEQIVTAALAPHGVAIPCPVVLTDGGRRQPLWFSAQHVLSCTPADAQVETAADADRLLGRWLPPLVARYAAAIWLGGTAGQSGHAELEAARLLAESEPG